MDPKPRHLGPSYAAQFEAASVARAYHTRPAYPPELFDTLLGLMATGPRAVLDLGCGTGDVALGLVGRVERIDAVDPSEAMLCVARARERADDPSLCFTWTSAEEFAFRGPYSLVVAAESLHWMDWQVVLPKIANALGAGAFLALVSGRSLDELPWRAQLASLILEYSCNREYRPYDLVSELSRRGLFHERGRQVARPIRVHQSVDDYVESFHTRNGLTRERMGERSAAEFDEALRDLVSRYGSTAGVVGETLASVIWGDVPASQCAGR